MNLYWSKVISMYVDVQMYFECKFVTILYLLFAIYFNVSGEILATVTSDLNAPYI